MWKSEDCAKLWGRRRLVEKSKKQLVFLGGNLSFWILKNEKDKIIVEKQEIFQQRKRIDRFSIFEFSTVFSTNCGKPKV